MTNTMTKMMLFFGLSLSLAACSKGATTSNGTTSLASSAVTTTTTATAATSVSLTTGQGLYAGQSYTSPFSFTIAYGHDGNLVVYNASNVLVWSSQTSGKCYSTCYMVFQTDGNLVLYNGSVAYWSSRTATSQLSGTTATQLVFNSTAPFLEVEDASNAVLWSSSASN